VRAPRYVPFVWGLIEVAAAAALLIFWHPEEDGALYWVRGILFVLFSIMAFGSLKRVVFASDSEIHRIVQGEYDANDRPQKPPSSN
jgi:hypothetical protein